MARTKQTAVKQTGGGNGGTGRRSSGRQITRKQLATKEARKSAPAATSDYSDATIAELKASMTALCHYCDKDIRNREWVRSHMLYKCPVLRVPLGLGEMAEKIKSANKTEVKAKVTSWKACPIDGMVDMTLAQFPPGTVCAPWNWLYMGMDKNKRNQVPSIRPSGPALLYKPLQKNSKRAIRKRYYTDKEAHREWEAIVTKKIQNGEVDEILIPVYFWYYMARIWRTLDDMNHAALIVLKKVDGRWSASFYDSQEDDKFYIKASRPDVHTFLSRRLKVGTLKAVLDGSSKRPLWLKREPIYKSLSGNGCQGVVIFWIHLRYMGLPIVHPNNTDVVNYFKSLMFHVGKKSHPLMEGEKFDSYFKPSAYDVYAKPDPEPEMQPHVEAFKKAIRAANGIED